MHILMDTLMNTTTTKTLAALLLAAAGAAQAQVGPWTPLGDVLVQGGSLTLSTAFNADDDAPFNLSGTPAAFIQDLENASAVQAYALDLLDQPAYEGSLVQQSLAVQAGDTLQFNWAWATQETLFEDHAFFVVDGSVFTIALRSTAAGLPATFSHTFTGSGTSLVSIGIVDTGDFNGVSTLNISNVQLAPVPEPGTWALMLMGGALLARRLQRQAQSRVR